MGYSRDIISKKIFDLSPEAMVVVNKSGKVVDVNNRMSDWLGYEPDEVVGKAFMLLELITTKSKAMAVANLAKRFAGLEIKPYEMEFLKSNGERVVGLVRGSIIENEEGNKYDLVMISEITEIAEDKLKFEVERDKIKKYIDLAGVLFISLDIKGNITLVNREASDVLGYKEKELLGKNWFEIAIPKESREEIRGVFEKIISEEMEGVDWYKSDVLTRSGKKRIVNWHNTPLKNDDGEVVGLLGAGRDITEDIEKENKLAELKRKYEIIVMNASEVFYIHDKNHKLTFVSPRCEKMFGYTPNEMKIKWTELVTDNPINKKGLEKTEKAIKTGVTGEPYMLEFVKKNGDIFWGKVIETPLINENDEVIGMTGSLSDVTEEKKHKERLKQSKERFKAIFENSPDAIYLYDKTGTLVDGNRKAEEVTGYNREELIGKSFLKLNLLSKDQIPLAAKRAAEVAMGKQTGPDEYVLTRKDGEKVVLETRSYPIKVGEKKLLMGVAKDITELKEVQSRLGETEKQITTLYENMREGVAFHKLIRNDEGEPIDYVISQVNPAFEKNTGLKVDQVIGKISTEAFGVERPPFFDKYLRVMETGKPLSFEEYFEPLDKYFSISATSPEKDVLITVFSDISERKKWLMDLEKFKLGLEKSNEVVFITNRDGVFEYINPAFETIYGYSFKEIEGKTPRVLHSGERNRYFYENFWNTILSGSSIEVELTNKNKEGKKIMVQTSVNPINRDNEIVGFLALQRDISNDIELENKLNERANQLERINNLMVGRELRMAELKKKLTKYESGSGFEINATQVNKKTSELKKEKLNKEVEIDESNHQVGSNESEHEVNKKKGFRNEGEED